MQDWFLLNAASMSHMKEFLADPLQIPLTKAAILVLQPLQAVVLSDII